MRVRPRRLPAIALLCPTLLLFGGEAAAGGEERIAVIVGSNIGLHSEEPLFYAEQDARRVRDLLIELGGVSPRQAIINLRGSGEDVLRALQEVKGRAAKLQAAGKRVAFLFYFSGHGDDSSLHLPRGKLALDQLRRAVAQVPGTLRIAVIDACRTARTEKGVRRGPAFALSVDENTPRGMVELRSSSAGEAAQESHKLSGSLFTHYLVSGLRGGADRDGDGQVTLAEAYAHIYRRTLGAQPAAAGRSSIPRW